MPSRRLSPVCAVVCALLLLSFAGEARGQTILNIPATACVWRAGDNPAWAAPGLAGSGWKPLAAWKISAYQPWMWVRCDVNLAVLRRMAHPALQVNARRAYQVFLNGEQVGHNGDLRTGQASVDPVRTFRLAAADLGAATDTVALRMKFRAAVDENDDSRPPMLTAGDAGRLQDHRNTERVRDALAFLPVAVAYMAIGVMAFVLLGLYLNDRTHSELLLLALICWGLSLLRGCDICAAAMVPMPSSVWWAGYGVGNAAVIVWVFFIFGIARRRVPLAYKILVTILLSYSIYCLSIAFLPARISLWIDVFYGRVGLVELLGGILLMAAPLTAFWPWREIAKGMRAVAVCAMLWGAIDILWFAAELGILINPTGPAFFFHWRPVMLELRAFGTMAVIVALIALLFREQRRTAQDRAMLAGEMRAAQEIQRLLVPSTVQTASGIQLEIAFQPMREVGGDFYLCRALADGRQRVLVGDVSGKGAAAAMTAALLIGAAERRDGDSPAALLTHLNLVLAESQVGGFATCMCADLAADGTLTLANAGHLAPYCQGEEVAVAPSLPLGVSASDAAYEEQQLHLAEGDTLTFVSDGVVEARSPAGELFGFERTQEISRESADRIAAAAEAFGQSDDITVLKLRREKAGRTAKAREPVLIPEPA